MITDIRSLLIDHNIEVFIIKLTMQQYKAYIIANIKVYVRKILLQPRARQAVPGIQDFGVCKNKEYFDMLKVVYITCIYII